MLKYTAWVILFSCILSNKVFAQSVSANVASLPSFGNVYVFNSSEPARFLISGSGLSSNITITAPNGFEVSAFVRERYSSILTIPVSTGSITNYMVYIRFSPATTGSQSGNIVVNAVGSNTVNINVSGVGINNAIPANYYSTVNTQRGAGLKTVLFNKISANTTATSYTPGVWNAFYTTDIQYNGKVWDIYSTRFAQNPPYEFTLGTDQDGGSGGTAEGQKYNREHSFPQSWFASSSPMQSDLHHVFASDKYVNAQRGDLPFGNVSTSNYTSLIGNKRGTGSNFGYTGNVFEPSDEYKGDLARAQLYMATRYENNIAGWQTNGTADVVLAGNAFPAFDAWFIQVLLAWHELDPVSDKEIKRNNAIYAIQNNRNPFVDSPQFVQRIWGGPIAAEPTLAASNLIITNLSNTSVRLNWQSGNGTRRLVIVRPTSLTAFVPTDTIFYAANAVLPASHTTSNANIVYNGTGSSVVVANLLAGVNYTYTIIEYNGWYTTSNYFTQNTISASATTLPVSWLYFSATSNQQVVNLLWETASEINNDYFTVERSVDGQIFNGIGHVKGSGNSNAVKRFTFTDKQLPKADAMLYYRIKQTDFDKQFSYSNVRFVYISNNESNEDVLKVLPNPFSNEFTIESKADLQNISVEIYNLNGKQVWQNQFNQNGKVFNCGVGSDLMSGMYVLLVYNADGKLLLQTKLAKLM